MARASHLAAASIYPTQLGAAVGHGPGMYEVRGQSRRGSVDLPAQFERAERRGKAFRANLNDRLYHRWEDHAPTRPHRAVPRSPRSGDGSGSGGSRRSPGTVGSPPGAAAPNPPKAVSAGAVVSDGFITLRDCDATVAAAIRQTRQQMGQAEAALRQQVASLTARLQIAEASNSEQAQSFVVLARRQGATMQAQQAKMAELRQKLSDTLRSQATVAPPGMMALRDAHQRALRACRDELETARQQHRARTAQLEQTVRDQAGRIRAMEAANKKLVQDTEQKMAKMRSELQTSKETQASLARQMMATSKVFRDIMGNSSGGATAAAGDGGSGAGQLIAAAAVGAAAQRLAGLDRSSVGKPPPPPESALVVPSSAAAPQASAAGGHSHELTVVPVALPAPLPPPELATRLALTSPPPTSAPPPPPETMTTMTRSRLTLQNGTRAGSGTEVAPAAAPTPPPQPPPRRGEQQQLALPAPSSAVSGEQQGPTSGGKVPVFVLRDRTHPSPSDALSLLTGPDDEDDAKAQAPVAAKKEAENVETAGKSQDRQAEEELEEEKEQQPAARAPPAATKKDTHAPAPTKKRTTYTVKFAKSLGVQIGDLGVIEAVQFGSAADNAGVREGDTIAFIDGVPLSHMFAHTSKPKAREVGAALTRAKRQSGAVSVRFRPGKA